MVEKKSIRAIVSADADKKITATGDVKTLFAAQRLIEAAKTLGMFWGAGILFIFIPVLHFFLVPGAVIIGLAMAIRKYTFTTEIVGISLNCPACSKPLPVDAKPFSWPKRVNCPSCQARIILVVD